MKKALLVLFVLALAAWATPNLISYQGKLDKDGEPFSGEASMNFALYESEDAGTPFWNETQTVTVVNGIFNVLLGSVEELPAFAHRRMLARGYNRRRCPSAPTDNQRALRPSSRSSLFAFQDGRGYGNGLHLSC